MTEELLPIEILRIKVKENNTDRYVICPKCKGENKVFLDDTFDGYYQEETKECNVCNGDGVVFKHSD